MGRGQEESKCVCGKNRERERWVNEARGVTGGSGEKRIFREMECVCEKSRQK